ncbi:MAG: DUF1579 domain-containing protein [Planctomycetes bacterium]|nr:DUF1579 domain-containing protein [Planctomycetota bacterium]
MKMQIRPLLGAAVLVGATTLITGEVVSRQHDGEMNMEEMWETWMKLAEPGPEHAELASLAGTWHQKNTHWPAPGAEPMVSESVATFAPIMGGRFMVEKVHGEFEMNGEVSKFEAMGIFGYDNLKEKHVFSWVDNHGTMIMNGEGTADATGKVITYYSTIPNPMTGGTMEFKSVSRVVNDERTIFEMHQKDGDSWVRNMEIVGSRKRRGGARKKGGWH